MDGYTVLIDPFNGAGHAPYRGISHHVWQRELSRGADLLLYTHLHDDHFDPVMTATYLSAHPETRLLLPREGRRALERAGACLGSALFLEGPQVSLDLPGLTMTAYATRHIGCAPGQVPHYSFLLSGTRVVLDTGDATPSASNFRAMPKRPLDLAVCTPLFLLGPSARQLLDQVLDVRLAAVVHMPDLALDAEGMGISARQAAAEWEAGRILLPESDEVVYPF